MGQKHSGPRPQSSDRPQSRFRRASRLWTKAPNLQLDLQPEPSTEEGPEVPAQPKNIPIQPQGPSAPAVPDVSAQRSESAPIQPQSSRTPVDNLNDDLLVLIFTIACQSGRWSERPPFPDLEAHSATIGSAIESNPGPILPICFTISHVSRRWRSIGLSTPLLWSNITLMPPEYPTLPNNRVFGLSDATETEKLVHRLNVEKWKAYCARVVRIVWVQIERSMECPLHVYFRTTSVPYLTEERLIKEAERVDMECFTVLFPTMARWKSAVLNLRGLSSLRSPCAAFLTVRPESVPLLEYLEITASTVQSNPAESRTLWEDMVPNFTLTSAPLISRLALGPQGWKDITSLPITWSHLTSLTLKSENCIIRRFRQGEALWLLERCPNLVRCSLYFTENKLRESRLLTSAMTGIPPDQAPPLFNDATVPMFAHPTADTPKVTLEHLEHLALIGVDHKPGLASVLTLPRLTSLSVIETLPDTGPSTSTGFHEWIAHYGDQLTRVAFDYTTLDTRMGRQCLAALPNITDLTLVNKAMMIDLVADSIYSTMFSRTAAVAQGLTPTQLQGQGTAANPVQPSMEHLPPLPTRPYVFIGDLVRSLTLGAEVATTEGGGRKTYTIVTADSVLCPKLTRLACKAIEMGVDNGGPAVETTRAITQLEFANFIASRREPDLEVATEGRVTRLQEVELVFPIMTDNPSQALDKELARRGVDLRGFDLRVSNGFL